MGKRWSAASLVLFLTLLAAAVLIIAVVWLESAVKLAGEVALTRQTRPIGEDASRYFQDLLEQPNELLVNPELSWKSPTLGATALVAPEALSINNTNAQSDNHQLDPQAGQEQRVFDALLQQAQHEELVLNDWQQARSTLESALQLPAAQVPQVRRVVAQARLTQLLCLQDQVPAAQAAWSELVQLSDGSECENGLPCLLIAGLSLSDTLGQKRQDPTQPIAAQSKVHSLLVKRWCSNSFALPQALPRVEYRSEAGLSYHFDTTYQLFLQELLKNADERDQERLQQDRLQRQQRALQQWIGPLPEVQTLQLGQARLSFLRSSLWLVWELAPPEGSALGPELGQPALQGRLLSSSDLCAALQAKAPFVPDPFELRIATGLPAETTSTNGTLPSDGQQGEEQNSSNSDTSTPVVAARVLRPGNRARAGELRLEILCSAPTRIVDNEIQRLRTLQASLLTIGILSLGAGLLSSRALRRSAKLQALKSRFVANVSHELRTPITGILLASENIQSGRANTPERLQRYHTDIQSEAQRLKGLVEDLLDFARMERGEGANLHLEERGCLDVIDALQNVAKKRTLRGGLRFEAPEPMNLFEHFSQHTCQADLEALRRAVGNLVENAVLHSGSDRVSFTAELQLTDAGAANKTQQLVLGIRDFGRGMNTQEAERLFHPFEQMEQDGHKSKGTGLGLAIVREVVTGHGGSVALEPSTIQPTAATSGSLFVIRLPCQPSAAQQPGRSDRHTDKHNKRNEPNNKVT